MMTLTRLPLCFYSFCLWFLLVSSLCSICVCNQNSDPVQCIPTERLALIDLKNNLTDHTNRLASWVGKDCCSWSGVVCDNITGHVHEIHLRGPDFYGPYDHMLGGSISPSVINLLQLRYLDLSFNDFGRNSIPTFIGSFQNLIYLNLSYSNFSGEIPHQLGNLSTLHVLDLNRNDAKSKSLAWLKNLKGLQHLDMGGINLKKASDWFLSVSNLTSLQELHFSDCVLNQLPSNPTTVSYTSLIVLDLSYNSFDTSMLPGWIFSLHNLASWIQLLTDLQDLDVSNANISDTIPNWFWTIFSTVYYLNMSHNNIQGKLGDVISFVPEATLDLSNNRLHGALPGNFSTAKFMDLSNNRISGSLEQFLCSSIQEPQPLEFLNLANNNMTGVISDCWKNFGRLIILNLEKNRFSGIIPSSLGNLSDLRSLEMDENSLYGNLPPWLLNSTSLVVIKLAENELVGKIPSSIGRNNTSLRLLSLRSNKLVGKIPDEVCHLSSLQILDLAHNDLSGNLPTCFTNFSVVSGRETSGPIVLYQSIVISASLVTKGNTYTYSTILYQVTSLDLSDNKFSGPIPDELVRLLGLRYLNLSHNDLTGTIPNLFNQTGTLESLDLSMNHLEGNIPLSLSQLTSLNCLNVSCSNLVGGIPTGPQFQTFGVLSFIGNSLCGGPLPACFQNNGSTEGIIDGHGEADGFDWILVIFTLVGLVAGFWIILAPLFISRRWRIAYYHFLDETWFKLQDFILLLFLRLTKRST